MGGKKGNRTKGNTRPSSSGRTAEMLSASGVTGFIGFTGLATEVPGFMTLGVSDDLESSVDSDFRMIMKKATKRDAITRVKALQEFSDLCQNKTEQAVLGALPYWPRLFAKLAVDHDRRVREATHQANKHLATKVKKDLAPYLKAMMGTWVVSMCDPYAPASSAAQEAFHVAFPSSKQPEALEFCKDEIFNFILDILFQQTAQTLSDVSSSSPEEVNSKYIRLVASSLKALKVFITTVTDLKKEKTVQYLSELLENNKFWKYANHKETEIQISWYLFISSLCQHMPDACSKYAAKLAPLTLGRIDETQPVVSSLIWEAILHLLVTVDNCWQFVNIRKAVLPQLWKLLRSGGNGNAGSTFKNLLPFLSKIPVDTIGSKSTFFTDFFENFKEGVQNERVQNSSSELKAVIQAFLECLQFVLFHRLSFDTDESEIRITLVQTHLLPLIELSLLDLNCNNQKAFFTEFGIFLKTVESLSAQVENTDISAAAKAVLDLIWNTIFDVFNKVLMVAEVEGADVKLKRFAQFLQHLHDKESFKKPRKVSFAKESEKEEQSENIRQRENYPRKTLLENTHKLCARLLSTNKQNPHDLYMKFLSEVIQTVASKELFTDLVKEYFVMDFSDNDEAVEKFINEVILHWLGDRENLFGHADHVISSILTVLLHACTCIPQQKAFAVLNNQCNMQDFAILESLISKLISNQGELPTLYAWLKSEQLGKSLVSLATNIGEHIDTSCNSSKPHDSWKLLKICFAATGDFEPLINVQYLNDILTVLTSVLLKQPRSVESSTAVVSFVCELAQSLLTSCLGCYQLTAVEDLLVCLFELNCTNKFLPSETQSCVRDTWCTGAEQLVKYQHGFLKENGFLCKASQTIQARFLKSNFQYSHLNDISVIEDNALRLLQNVASNLPQNDSPFLDKSCLVRVLIDEMLPSKELISKLQLDLSSKASNSRPHKLEVPLTQVLSETEEIHPLLIVVRFLVKIMNEFVCSSVSLEDSDGKVELSEDTKEFLVDNLTSMYLAVAYGSSMFIHPQIKDQSKISQMFLEISSTVSNIQRYLETESILQIVSKIIEDSSSDNRLFLLVFPKALSSFQQQVVTLQELVNTHLRAVKTDSSSDASNLERVLYLIPCASEADIRNLFVHVACMLNNEEIIDVTLSNQYLATLVCCLKSKQFTKPDTDCITRIFTFIQTLKNQCDIRLLCEVQIADHLQLEIEFSTIVSDFMCLFLSASEDVCELWIMDLILCTLCGWISTLNKSTAVLYSRQENVIFAQNVFRLLTLVKKYTESEVVKQNLPDLVNEWRDLYFPTVFSQVLPMFFEICAGSSKDNHRSWEDERMFDAISTTLHSLPTDEFVSCITNTQLSTKENDVIVTTDRLYSLLISDIPAVQWCTHNILVALMPKVAEIFSKEGAKEQDDNGEDGNQRLPPLPVSKILTLSGQVVDTMLSEFHVEDCCMVEPFTDSYSYTLTYLLSWLHMLKIFSCSNSEVRSEYALNFRCSKLLDNLLLNVFRLMPNNPVIFEKTTMFTESCHPESSSSPSSKVIQKVACQVYLNTLSQLPALVRQWWNKQDKRTADYVNKFTTMYVSGLISLEEIKAVQDTQTQFNNMTVKARPTAREVVAMYTMEDITIELVIRLPQNHPLGPVSVETGQRIGVSNTQWRHWMLQLTTFLTHQNGSILDALSLWKRNVDKRFEGVEECMICFYVLHGATCQLPRLTCKTCKKKFHSACLYKWFSTSQNASCPLCRNLF